MIYRGVKMESDKRRKSRKKMIILFGFVLLVVVVLALVGEYVLSVKYNI